MDPLPDPNNQIQAIFCSVKRLDLLNKELTVKVLYCMRVDQTIGRVYICRDHGHVRIMNLYFSIYLKTDMETVHDAVDYDGIDDISLVAKEFSS